MNAIYIAQAAANQQGDPMSMLITFGLIGVIFYFLLIRPQQKNTVLSRKPLRVCFPMTSISTCSTNPGALKSYMRCVV